MIAPKNMTPTKNIDDTEPAENESAKPKRNKRIPKIAPPPVLLVTEEEAADILRISVRSLWSLTSQGLIRCTRIGTAKRYSYSELQRFVEVSFENANS